MNNIKTAVVSGATGFVGYHLIKNLLKKNIYVIALCRKNSANIGRLAEFDNIKIMECDSQGLLDLEDELIKYHPDVFFHLLWDGTTGPERLNYGMQLLNVKYTCDAYVLAKKIGCKKYVATGTVYEDLTSQVWKSESLNGASFYILGKNFAYEAVKELAKEHKLEWVWCVFCQPVGRYMKLNQITSYTILSLLQGTLPSFGPATEYFDMISVEDLAEGLFLAASISLKSDRYFIGSGNPKPLKDYLIEIAKTVAPEANVVFGTRANNGLIMSKETLEDRRFVEETGFACLHSFSDSILNAEEWVKECMG